MKRSANGILTTHTGSLPRPDDLVAMVEGHDQRELRADPRFERRVEAAVGQTVREQVEAGITVVNDGEMSKVGYSTYVTERLTGFADQTGPVRPSVEARHFPEFYRSRQTALATIRRPACVGPIEWRGGAPLRARNTELA